MKSKVGFIPIVLPVLVMVLIIGLINIGNAPWVQAHDPDGSRDTDNYVEPGHKHNIPSTHPQLATFKVEYVTDGPSPLMVEPANGGWSWDWPTTDGHAAAGGDHVSRHEISAPYNVNRIQVTLTGGAETATPLAYKITNPTGSSMSNKASLSTSSLDVGQSVIEVVVRRAAGDTQLTSAQSTYHFTITREKPQFDNLELHRVGTDDDAGAVGDMLGMEDLLPVMKGGEMSDAALMGNNAELRDREVDVRVKYHVDEVYLVMSLPMGLDGEAGVAGDETVKVKFKEPDENVRTDVTGSEGKWVVKKALSVGPTVVGFDISTSTMGKSYSTSYQIVIHREKPQLESVKYSYGDGPTSVPLPLFFGDTSTYETTTSYKIDMIEVDAVPGASAKVMYSGDSDDDPDTGSYEMGLNQGANNVSITAYDGGHRTDYALTVNRDSTPLGNLILMSSSSNPGEGAMHVPLLQERDKKSKKMGFSSTTTEYYAYVDYRYTMANVRAFAEDGADDAGYKVTIRPQSGLGLSTTSVHAGTDGRDLRDGADNSPDTTFDDPNDVGGFNLDESADDAYAASAGLYGEFRLRNDDNRFDVTAEYKGNSQKYTLIVIREDAKVRPGELGLIEYRTRDGGTDFEPVSLTPSYHQDSSTPEYRASVRSHVASVGIAASHRDSMAVILVNGVQIESKKLEDINPSPDYREVLLTGDTTTITVSVLHGGNKGDVAVVVDRKAGEALTAQVPMHPDRSIANPLRLKSGEPLENPVALPAVLGTQGNVEYKVIVTDAQNNEVPIESLGLKFGVDEGSNPGYAAYITGTPQLDEPEAFSSFFEVEYRVSDTVIKPPFSHKFVLVITEGDGDEIGPLGVAPEGPEKNTLKSLKVGPPAGSLKGVPDFNGDKSYPDDSSGYYHAIVGANLSLAMIEAVPYYDDATVVMSDLPFEDGNSVTTDKFDQTLTIVVSHPDVTDSEDNLELMEYKLRITRMEGGDNTLRFKDGVEIGDKVYREGVDIDDLTLPSAIGGSRPYRYELVDNRDSEVNDIASLALDKDPNTSSPVLSGKPALKDENAFRTEYKLVYRVTDSDGNVHSDDFTVTVCDPTHRLSGDCRSSSDDVMVSGLELSGATLAPAFAAGTMDYMASVPYETMYTTVSAMFDDIDYDLGNIDVKVYVGGEMHTDADEEMDGHQVMLAAGTTTAITVQAVKEYGTLHKGEEYTVSIMRAGQPANPGFTPMNVEVMRDGSSATLTWTPGADATSQFVAAVILNPTTGSFSDTLQFAEVAGDVSSHDFMGLSDASVGTYIYAVWGYDDNNMWQDSDGNPYLGSTTEQ